MKKIPANNSHPLRFHHLIRIASLIVKELQDLFRNRRSASILILPVLLQVAVFPFVATLEVKNCTVGIFNEDGGQASVEYVQRIQASPYIAEAYIFDGEQAWSRALDEQKVLAALRIPSDFGARLRQTGRSSVQYVLDGRHSNSSQIVAGYLANILEGMIAEQGGDTAQREMLTVRHLYNGELEYQWIILPSLVALITSFSCLIVTSISLAREKEEGTYEQLLVTPLTPLQILVGKIVPAILVSLMQGSIIAAGAVFFYRVPFTGSVLLMYVSLALFSLSLAGIGLAISSVCRTQQQAFISVFCFLVPAIVLSGFLSPVENMPAFLQGLSRLDPLSYLLVVLKGVFLKGYGFHHAWRELAAFALIACGTLCFAYVVMKRRSGTD